MCLILYLTYFFDLKIESIKRGLQSVISKHIISILIWSEFEFKICGGPKITVEDLKMSSKKLKIFK